ncbi:unnamed protein product [Chrysoparadoxa australica]
MKTGATIAAGCLCFGTVTEAFLTPGASILPARTWSCQRQQPLYMSGKPIVTPLEKSSVKISVEIPAPAIQKYWDSAIRELSKQSAGQIPGFSGGRQIPPNVILSHYGENVIKGQALQAISDIEITNAIKETGVNAIGQATLAQEPKSLLAALVPGQPMSIEVKVDVWPEVDFTGEYTGLVVEADDVAYDQEKYDAAMLSLRERYAELSDTEDDYAAKEGDAIIADMNPYEVKGDGSRGAALPQVASGSDVEIVLSGERYMPGLVEGLVGIKAGETREIKVTFPEGLAREAKSLSGKTALFVIECDSVKTRSLPELTDAFADKLRRGLTMKELEEEVVESISDEKAQAKGANRNNALEEALLTRATVEIPETLVVEQARTKYAQMMAEMKDQGQGDEDIKKLITKENFEKYLKIARPSVEKSLSGSLIVSAIAEKEGMKVSELEIEDQMELIRAEAKGQEFDENMARERVESAILKEMVMNWVAERSTVTYK